MHTTAIQADFVATGAPPQLSPEVQNRIGTHLRLLYDQVVDEEIPQSLVELLRRLETKE